MDYFKLDDHQRNEKDPVSLHVAGEDVMCLAAYVRLNTFTFGTYI